MARATHRFLLKNPQGFNSNELELFFLIDSESLTEIFYYAYLKVKPFDNLFRMKRGKNKKEERKIERKIGIILILLLIAALSISKIPPIQANTTIYIKADGSINPSDVPLQRNGEYYFFTGNIYQSIEIQKSNIALDGNGYLLRGNWTEELIPVPGQVPIGILACDISNITIINLNIESFYCGILFDNCSCVTVSENNITKNKFGSDFWYGSSTIMTKNNVIGNVLDGIRVLFPVGNSSILTNHVNFNGRKGITLSLCTNSTFAENNVIGNNEMGISLWRSSDNLFYHNNFTGNALHIYDQSWNQSETASINVWDNDYPSGGNYWDDYNGTDINGDGIGDVPYIIDENNQDRYPFVPWVALPADLNKDRKIDILDIAIVALAYKSRPGDANWNSVADLDGNGAVDILDITIVAKEYGRTY